MPQGTPRIYSREDVRLSVLGIRGKSLIDTSSSSIGVKNMPSNRKINCPACGFSISADTRSCDFCGYEFETRIDEKPSAAAFKSELVQKQAESPGVQALKKNGNGKKNGNKPKSPVSVRKPEEDQKAVPAPSETYAGTARPSLEKSSAPVRSTVSAEDRIKELEKQLSEAEKELDVISKILVEAPKEKKQEPVAAAPHTAQVAAQTSKTASTETKRQVMPDRRGIQPGHGTAGTFGSSPAKRASLHLRLKAMTGGAIAIGAAVYVASVILSASIGSLEEYFLMVSGSALIALGLYSSLEAVEIDRPAFYHS